MTQSQTTWLTLETASADETETVGRRLAGALPPGTVVPLHGDLGAGKTVLARGLARGLGICEPVTSPTFALVQEYRCPGGGWFFHLDLYRIDGDAAALAFGIEDYLFRPDAITAVEWPERIAGLLKEQDAAVLPVYLESPTENRRRLRIPRHASFAPALGFLAARY